MSEGGEHLNQHSIYLDLDDHPVELRDHGQGELFRGVLEKILPEGASNSGTILALPLKRLSGRFYVYRVRLKQEEEPTCCYFIKIVDPRSSQERKERYELRLCQEYTNWLQHVASKPDLPTTQAAIYPAYDNDARATHALCVRGVGRGLARPLSEFLEGPLDAWSAGLVMKALEGICHYQNTWRRSMAERSVSIAEAYGTLYREERTTRFLETWIGRDGRERAASLLFEMGLACPWHAASELLRSEEPIDTLWRPVHRDMHQRNIMVESSDLQTPTFDGRATPGVPQDLATYLIDFEWTGSGHALSDWVLLEASLKLLACAGYFSETEYLSLHDALDRDDDFATLEGHHPGRHLWEILREIRRLSKPDAVNSEWRRQYYAASLLTTMGLLTVPECPSRLTYLTAAWMAAQIQDMLDLQGES